MNATNDMAALAQQQRDLLTAIFTTKNVAIYQTNTPATGKIITPNRGLQTYQANAHASALRSLQTAYPVIAQLLGDDAFAHLASEYWAKYPPTRGDLTQWGGELAVFIASIETLKIEPYLSDVATVEWALHTAATAADQITDLTTFSLLTEQDPDLLTLQFAPGTTLIHSKYPIASILTAHLHADPSFEAVGQKLQQNTPEIALIWRKGLRPRVSSCTDGEAAFIHQLLNGKSLLAALEMSPTSDVVDDSVDQLANLDYNTWLPQAVQNGLLLGARLL